MTMEGQSAALGFHSGELAVQQRAGVQAQAARLAPMLDRVELRSGVAAFLARATFGAFSARDPAGRLWVSPLSGPPGFLQAVTPRALRVEGTFPDGDPLHGLRDGQAVGLIVMDFAARRRVRINGTLTATTGADLTVAVEQAYGNCPQYIQQRHLRAQPRTEAGPERVRRGQTLTSQDISLIQAADTFFLGTTHPERGNDASHRGGPVGFVHAKANQLCWPDYPGNNMFNSFGNLSIDPTAALLFVDFRRGRTLQLSGTATVLWADPDDSGDDAPTGRRACFTAGPVVATTLLPIREASHRVPPDPALTDK